MTSLSSISIEKADLNTGTDGIAIAKSVSSTDAGNQFSTIFEGMNKSFNSSEDSKNPAWNNTPNPSYNNQSSNNLANSDNFNTSNANDSSKNTSSNSSDNVSDPASYVQAASLLQNTINTPVQTISSTNKADNSSQAKTIDKVINDNTVSSSTQTAQDKPVNDPRLHSHSSNTSPQIATSIKVSAQNTVFQAKTVLDHAKKALNANDISNNNTNSTVATTANAVAVTATSGSIAVQKTDNSSQLKVAVKADQNLINNISNITQNQNSNTNSTSKLSDLTKQTITQNQTTSNPMQISVTQIKTNIGQNQNISLENVSSNIKETAQKTGQNNTALNKQDSNIKISNQQSVKVPDVQVNVQKQNNTDNQTPQINVQKQDNADNISVQAKVSNQQVAANITDNNAVKPKSDSTVQTKSFDGIKPISDEKNIQTKTNTNSNESNLSQNGEKSGQQQINLADQQIITASQQSSTTNPVTHTEFSTVMDSAKTQNISTDSLVNQISQKAANALAEKSQVSIVLNPENLGKVDINLTSDKGVITAQITAENVQVKDLLSKGLDSLQQNLQDQGININKVVVQVQAPQASTNNHDFQQDSQYKQEQFANNFSNTGSQNSQDSPDKSYNQGTGSNYTNNDAANLSTASNSDVEATQTGADNSVQQQTGRVDYIV